MAALALAVVFVLCGIAAIALAHSRAILPDFLSFWAAGRLAFEGQPVAAYDLARHGALEAQIVSGVGLLPFPYPPPFLAILAPFGMLPFWIAFGAWVAITAGLYLIATRKLIDPRFSFAQAGSTANFITGQNGFLTSAIFIGGTNLLATRPLAGGAVLGLLSFKPQLAILLPVALLAGREWRAILGGLASSIAIFAAGLLLFGADAYRGFFAILPQSVHLLSEGRWPWGEMASPLALLRGAGVPQNAAMAVQAAIALIAAAVTVRAWAMRIEARVPVLAAATLLVTPYLFTYDALLLTVPLAWLGRHQTGRIPFLAIWLLSLLPIAAYFMPFPNTIPLAAIVALWALHRTPAPRDTPESAYQV